MEQAFCEAENVDPALHQRWLDKHGFKPTEDGSFKVSDFDGKIPVTQDKLIEYIRANVSTVDYIPLYAEPYDERVFVMVCGGPSLSDHLDEIRVKAAQSNKYLVVCSNMTASYLLEHGITPHVHFILDPQEKKRLDVAPGKTSPSIQYWINAACHPAVFDELSFQGLKPYMFLADFDADGKAVAALKESLQPGQPGMMAIQGGTMAGLRAINLADAMGFRSMEYYGFDATVMVKDGKAQPYAYSKKRGEAIIEVTCDKCDAKFDTTLIFQKQVNEFVKWHIHMPWMDINIIGGGLISHYYAHVKELEEKERAAQLPHRYTKEYAIQQKTLHSHGNYGVSGKMFVPTIFHGISQLAKRHGSVTVLDYGSAGGKTMNAVRDQLFIPPAVTDTCYDPFVDEYSSEPVPSDMVLCTDVLEHVEPECTNAVLDHLAALTKKIIFLSISLQPANKVLDDGRNAHINLRTSEFWLKEIKKRFIISEAKVTNNDECCLIVAQSIDAVRIRVRELRMEAA